MKSFLENARDAHKKNVKLNFEFNVVIKNCAPKMPQLDLFSYFSATTVLIVLFITLIFVLHTYFLPKIATCLKFRKKIQLKQENTVKIVETEKSSSEPFLDVVNKFIIEIEKTVKQLANK